ncbi:MAG: hypothetical protein HOP28_15680, partial [Gemmatimonadales bacterium]|nr:hypothetical protein [Gemmatimonadales bacterium]
GEWKTYRTVTPIWKDRLDRFGGTRLLLAHARSAFRNEGVQVENNMPFVEEGAAFVFNGELRGVRLQAEGRIGAEKLFRVFRRMGGDERTEALTRAMELVVRRTSYVRAMNFVLATGTILRIGTHYSESPDYFTMHVKEAGARQAVCSEGFPGESGWRALPNGTVLEWS